MVIGRRKLDPRERARAERSQRVAQQRADREKLRKKRTREATRSSSTRSKILLSLGIVALVGVAAGLLVLISPDDEAVDGPESVTVYMIDTSGSQQLGAADSAERDRARVDRLKRAATDEADRSGILVVSTFADEGTGVATREFDFSPKALECRKRDSDVCQSRRDKAVEALEEELTAFVSDIDFAGHTDILGGAVSRAATIARATWSETDGRRLIIESDFLDTECPSPGDDISSWPQTDEAAEALEDCAGSDAPISEFRRVQLNGVVLTDSSDLADVQRAVEAFLGYCALAEARCVDGR